MCAAGVYVSAMREHMVRIPRTSPRNSKHAFARLLNRVDPDAAFGGFEGMLITPGKLFPASVLWPDPSYPQIPLLLECAGPITNHRGHKRNEWLWILWRYEPDSNDWLELARALAVDASWTHVLRPIAVRELRGRAVQPAEPSVFNLVADRLVEVIDTVLEDVPQTDRPAILNLLESTVAARLLAIAA